MEDVRTKLQEKLPAEIITVNLDEGFLSYYDYHGITSAVLERHPEELDAYLYEVVLEKTGKQVALTWFNDAGNGHTSYGLAPYPLAENSLRDLSRRWKNAARLARIDERELRFGADTLPAIIEVLTYVEQMCSTLDELQKLPPIPVGRGDRVDISAVIDEIVSKEQLNV
jgi:hypothetical protein